MKKFGFLGLLLLAVGITAVADDRQLLTAEVLWNIQRIGAPVISPDGQRVVAPVTSYDLDSDDGETRLWLFHADGSKQRPVTAQGQNASSPVFSPDGSHLAFVSRRQDDEQGQIYLLPMDQPGEAQRLTEVSTGVAGIKWVGDHLYFISRIWPGKDWDEMAEQQKNDSESHVSAHQWNALPYAHFDHWIDEDRQAHVFRIPADGGEVEAITSASDWELPRSSQSAASYDISPDENWIAFTADSRRDGTNPKIDLFLMPIGSTEAQNITADSSAGDSQPQFSPDGNRLAWVQQRIPGFYADTRQLWIRDIEQARQSVLTDDWDRSADGLVWAPDSASLFGAIDDAGTRRIYQIDASSGQVRPITGDTSFANLAIANDATLVATNESFLHPARLVVVEHSDNGAARRLDSLNDELLADIDFGSYESVSYEGYNGQEIQMWVHYPPGFDRSKRYPLFLLIHGGPHSAITDGFHYRWNAQTFASWGYVTAWHNFHGSSGFGQEFTDSINPDWLTAPYQDTIAAADWFAGQDFIDSERMVAGGGSYGGYLSSMLLGMAHPFKALLIHAPVYNMYSQMAADFSVHGVRFGEYWDKPEIYRDISPHYRAGDFDTPALIIHGQQDLRVPVGQSFELFRTLQTRGVRSRLIYYPDENHWILKPNNSLYWYQQVRDWMAEFAEPGAQ